MGGGLWVGVVGLLRCAVSVLMGGVLAHITFYRQCQKVIDSMMFLLSLYHNRIYHNKPLYFCCGIFGCGIWLEYNNYDSVG